MQSKSNFESHYDLYIIEYNSFKNDIFIPGSVWQMETEINGAPLDRLCDVDPQDPEDPAGPTFRYLLRSSFSPASVQPSGIVAENFDKIKKMRSKKHFTFKVAANHFIDKDLKQVLKTKTGRKSANARADHDDRSVEYPT